MYVILIKVTMGKYLNTWELYCECLGTEDDYANVLTDTDKSVKTNWFITKCFLHFTPEQVEVEYNGCDTTSDNRHYANYVNSLHYVAFRKR